MIKYLSNFNLLTQHLEICSVIYHKSSSKLSDSLKRSTALWHVNNLNSDKFP